MGASPHSSVPSKDSVGSGRSRRFRAGTRRWTTALGAAAVAAVSVSGLVLGAGSAAAATGTTVSVTPSNLQGFDFAETRATGHYEFTADGLHIRTEGNTSTDKVAAYKPVSATLASVAAGADPAVDYTNTAGIKPGYQMAFDKDGDGGFDGFLVGEPDAYGMKWWDNSGLLTPKDASLAGCDYKICATLDDISAAYPQAKISAIGFSLGSGVKGDGVLSSLTFLDTTYTFGLDPVANGGPADIAVKLDAPLLTNVGTDIPLTVTVTNNGPNAAGPFNVSAVTPGYDIKSAPGGTVAGNTATIPVTYLDKGATKTFVVTAKASAGFQLGLGVAYVVPGASPDTNLFNNFGITLLITR